MNRRRFAATLAAAALAVGCGGSDDVSPVGPGDSNTPFTAISGTYALRTAGGVAPPAVVDQSASTTTEIIGEGITLEANGTWTMTTIRRTTTTSPASSNTLHLSDSGTFSVSGNAITLTSTAGGGTVNGTVGNGRLTTTRFNKSFVYLR